MFLGEGGMWYMWGAGGGHVTTYEGGGIMRVWWSGGNLMVHIHFCGGGFSCAILRYGDITNVGHGGGGRGSGIYRFDF